MIFNGFIGFTPTRVKRCFRPGTLSFLLMLFTALPSFAAPEKVQSARKQVTAAVQHHAAQALRQEAGRRKWPEYQAKMNLFIPSDVSRYAPCPDALTVSLPGGDASSQPPAF